MDELTRAREFIHATEWEGDLRRNLMNAIGAGRVLANRITELERINAELLAACREAMAAPDAFEMKSILGSVLSEVSNDPME